MGKAIMLLAVAFAISSGLVAQTDMTVLMCVTTADGMAEGEVTMKTRLEELGMVVDAVTAGDTQSDDALSYDLVFVHEAISSSAVGNKFKDIPTPLMSTEFYIADDMAFTGTTLGTDYGQLDTNPQTDFLLVEDVEHPITEGFTGDVVVYDGVGNMGFGVPQGDGLSLLSYPQNPEMSMLFTYEEGSADLNGDEVPARRVFFFTFNGYEGIMNDDAWTLFDRSVRWLLGIEAKVTDKPANAPQLFHLSQNYPNPFNPVTKIDYDLSKTGHVRLDVFNTRGEKVSTLVDEQQTAGSYSVTFDASELPTGIYLYRLYADDRFMTKKMALAK
ncbi:T9SS type A sorting domain-containing protein [candidate division KSB1 bacterium]|nr:T9SS type A sorting domain-containing protein [candidate division KSB1 bacterium]